MTPITIDPDLLAVLPNVRFGCIEAEITVETDYSALKKLLNDKISELENILTAEIIRETDTVKATKNAYRLLGKDPNRYRPAAEALMRRIANKKGLYGISNVVDVLNLVSIETGFSICGYDKSKIQGGISFGKGKEGEPYEGIGRGHLNIENLPVFRDELGAFGTPTSDSVRTMIDDTTKEVLFIFVDFGQSDSLEGTLQRCAELLNKYAQATDLIKSIT